MDPNELVVILDRAIANLPDPSAEGRRRVYERVERTIRTTCTPEGGEMDMERYHALRRDLGAAIAIIEQKRRSAAPTRTAAAPASAAPIPPPPPRPVEPPVAVSQRATASARSVSASPAAASPAVGASVVVPPAPPPEVVEPLEDDASPPWLKRIGIGAAALAVVLAVVIAVLPGGPLRSLLAGAPTDDQPPASTAGSPVDPFAGVPAPQVASDPTSPETPDAGTDPTAAFAPLAPQPGVPRVTDVKVSILNGASEWRTERLSGFDDLPAGPPIMALAQDRETPLLVSLYCDTPDLTVFRVAYGTNTDALREEISERGSMDGVQRQRIQIKTDRNEGFAGDFLALTAHSWGIRMAPENIETLRAGKQIEVMIGETVAGTVSLSGATPAIDEALAGGSCS